MNYTINKNTNTRNNFRNTTSQNTNYRSIRTKRKTGSSIDPARLIKKAIFTEEVKFVPVQTFEQLTLNEKLKANLFRKGFVNPTKIQEETLEHLISGRDLLGVANTGTGKTGAFLIPVIEQLLNSPERFKTLVVVPTRELALQIEEEFKSLTKGMGIYASSFIGGTNLGRDFAQLQRNNQLIIGTPGRLMDLSDRGALKLQEISILIIDEFDRMLDMGFVDDIKTMVASMKNRKQTMLFSATIDKTQKSLINGLLNNPIEVKVNTNTTTSDQVEQDIIKVPRGGDKFTMLLNLFDNQEFAKVLIFAETKRLVDNVTKRLNQFGVKSDLIHGDKTQNYRNNALNSFKRGRVKVLVATDVAARGIDVSDVTHVINYELPMSFDSYVHRIGRTGRAGKKGKALTFID